MANRMGIEIDDKIEKSTVLTDDQFSILEFNSLLRWDADKMFPYYFHKNNIIIIPCHYKLDDLVHELFHYFRVMYLNLDFDCNNGMMNEAQEIDAILIQRWFEANLMKARSPH